jgi:hypothetical protein
MQRSSDGFCRQLQHRLDAGAPQDIDQLINGQLGLLDQLHQGQQGLPILPQKMNQRLGIILVDGVIGFLHGASLLYQRIRSPILNESGLRTAAQPPTETWAPSRGTRRLEP